jgi:hypothetical protein
MVSPGFSITIEVASTPGAIRRSAHASETETSDVVPQTRRLTESTATTAPSSLLAFSGGPPTIARANPARASLKRVDVRGWLERERRENPPRGAGLLRGFDRLSRRLNPLLAERYGAEFADETLADARREFERLIPDLPYIGGRRNVFSPIMVVTGWMIALHRAMALRGRSADEVARICVEVSDGFLRSFPDFLLRLLGRLAFTRPVKSLLKRQAKRSHERRYPADFVYSVVEGPNDEVALVFEECAVNKFLDARSVPKLKPYCNFFDVTYSRLMSMGLDAHETIGLGCERCALRFQRGRKTATPEKLAGLFPAP